MANIGGNITGRIQIKTASSKNAIGEAVGTWEDAFSQKGWLGLQSGEQKRSTFNAKIEESTHVFLCDYHSGIYALTLPNVETESEYIGEDDCNVLHADKVSDCRMIIKGFVYDVTLIDNPDEMDEQLEIYLKRVGAWDGKN